MFVVDDEQPARTATSPSLSAHSASKIVYSVKDDPPWPSSILLGVQHFVTTTAGAASVLVILGPALCILDQDLARGYLVSSILIVSGLSTLIQCFIGVRLPIVQGPNVAWLACVLSLLRQPKWTCPSHADLYAMGVQNRTAEWQDRMREVQGAIISVSLLEVLIGYSGLIGLILRYTSPLTISPIIILLGLSMAQPAVESAADNWYFAIATVIFVIMLSQYLPKIHSRVPSYSIPESFHMPCISAFQLFPILIGAVLMSLLYWILSTCHLVGLQPEQSYDTRSLLPWFWLPYPFQWGFPRFSVDSMLVMGPGILLIVTQAVGSYYACAAISGVALPPTSATSRGVGAEGLACLLAGLFGCGTGIGSSSESIGGIAITKCASRRMLISGSVLIITSALFPKFGSPLLLMPKAIAGALLCINLAIIAASGFISLQFVNMRSHRNMLVLGCSLFFGLMVPLWLATHKKELKTGFSSLDEIMSLLLSSHIVVGACSASLLDNITPGRRCENGLVPWLQDHGALNGDCVTIYQLPNRFRRVFSTKRDRCVHAAMEIR